VGECVRDGEGNGDGEGQLGNRNGEVGPGRDGAVGRVEGLGEAYLKYLPICSNRTAWVQVRVSSQKADPLRSRLDRQLSDPG